MNNLIKYPKYKPSGIPWIGDVPEHWECNKLRSILSSVSKKNCPHLPLLSVVREKGVIVRNVSDDSENHNVIPEDLTNYKVVNPGQFAMNKMKAWQGSYGISKYQGIVSPAYFVFNLRKVEPSFFHVAMRSKVFIPFFAAASDGIRVGQWDLSISRMREIPFFIPSETEQLQISRFLDWKVGQINKFIKAKKRIIELLKEQKQAIINDAVTGKIDVRTGKPYPKYKPSGVEWLGDIPEEWEVRRLKIVAKLFGRIGFRGYSISDLVEPGEGAITLSPSNMKENGMNYKKCSYLSWKKYFESPEIIVSNGDILLVKTGSSFGKSTLVEDLPEKATINPQILLITKINVYNQFLDIALKTDVFLNQVYTSVIGGTIPTISQTKLGSFYLIFPKSNKTQIEIVETLKNKTSSIDITISRIEKELELILEYKNRLISDAVTGKIDVQDIEVPEVIEDIEEEILEEENEELEEMEGEE